MQITIDVRNSTPTDLRTYAAFLTFIASQKDPLNPNLYPHPDQSQQTQTPPVTRDPPPQSTSDEQSRTSNPPPPPSSSGVEGEPGQLVDSEGVLWNPEHHTANQSKNADGTWRRKRTPKGEAPASTPRTVELPNVPPPPPTDSKPTVEPAPSVPPAPPSAATPAATAVPPAPPVSTVPTTHNVTTFAQLVKFATNLVGNKTITTSQLLEACKECGVADIYACNQPNNPGIVVAVATALEKRVGA